MDPTRGMSAAEWLQPHRTGFTRVIKIMVKSGLVARLRAPLLRNARESPIDTARKLAQRRRKTSRTRERGQDPATPHLQSSSASLLTASSEEVEAVLPPGCRPSEKRVDAWPSLRSIRWKEQNCESGC